MKKQSSTRFLMWVMVIWLHAHFSIAAVLSKSIDTTTSVVCDGTVEDCLNVDHLDSQLPTISSSHFRRILAGCNNNRPTTATKDPRQAAFCKGPNDSYIGNGAKIRHGVESRCADPDALYRADCH